MLSAQFVLAYVLVAILQVGELRSTLSRDSSVQEIFAMSTVAQAHERIDLRTSPEIKELIVRAASTAGMSVSAFLLGTAQERARQILADSEMITLTSRDWSAFAKALDNADKPRPKLSAAVKRHRDWQQGKP